MSTESDGRDWLVLDFLNQPGGPYTLSEVCVLLRTRALYVCKQGGAGWALACTVPEIQNYVAKGTPYLLSQSSAHRQARLQTATDALLRLCRGFMSDGSLSGEEIHALNAWFETHDSVLEEWPGNLTRIPELKKGRVV